jgi:16S rRNA (guanine1516-N2)-methyltransferase
MYVACSSISLRRIVISTFECKLVGDQLSLVFEDQRMRPLSVNFLSGKVHHRRAYGGGQGQLIAKAVGVKKLGRPSVLDLSAGFGQDAFVLAALGCRVTMLERCEVMAQLLADGLRRLYVEEPDMQACFQLIHADAYNYLSQLADMPDVIYFDPMYPNTGNSAQCKKEMQVLRLLAGDDQDAADVLDLARTKAKKRVVIKRPRHGVLLGDQAPSFQVVGKSSRFDVYVP